MSFSSKVTVAFALTILPFAVALAAPGNVTGIKGDLRDGKAHVSWQKPAGEEVAGYRIFYSRQSILQKDGLYDDFETVPGNLTDYTFESLPFATPTLYVSVLAVNASGEESALFAEEARIDFVSAGSSSAVMQQTSSKAQNAAASTMLRMLTAKADSATGVLITFSDDVVVDASRAAQAFTVRDGSGQILRMTRLIIQGKEVTIHTVTQEKGRVYRLEASAEIVSGKNTADAAIQLDSQQSPILFAGHETGIPYGSSPSSQVSSVATVASSASSVGAIVREDVRNLTVKGQAQGASYVIEASWVPATTAGIREFRVSQSRDKGRTYGQAQVVPATANGVKIAGVPAGEFGLMVQTVYTDNTITRGVTKLVTLPVLGSPLQGSTVQGPQPAPGKGALPNSGIALIAPMLMAAAGAGAQVYRQRKLAAGKMEA